MSRRRKKIVQMPKASISSDMKQAANDGYVNSLAYLGEASALTQANDYERHSISNDYNLLTILYRENWLAARIIDTPCEDMTRSWYSVASEMEQDKLDELQKLEAKHSVKQEITNAIRWGRLYGGAAAVMVIKGQEDMLDQPLDYDMLQPGCFRGLIVIDKVRGIFPSIELEEDMDDVEFGYPKWYQVTLNEETGEIVTIHHSRLLLFRGRQLPIDEEVNADYWGASELEHVYEELQKRNSSSANIAQLIFQANVAAIKIADYGEVLGMGTQQQRQQVYRTMEEMNRLRTSFGVTLMGTEDSYEQHPYSFAGVAEVYETFMMDMAGASEIPATKLFGRAPQGMNATGESDMKNYYEVISQLQERILRPALEKLLPVMSMSLWGEIPEDLEIVFEPLGTTTPSERAEIMGQSSTPIIQAFQAGLISQKVALMELRESGKPINAWTNISDEDIENAEAEVDQGEEMQDPMGMMGPQVPPGTPPEAPPQEIPQEAPQEVPQEMPEEVPQEVPENTVDMGKVRELKERIQKIRGAEEPEEVSQAERIQKLKERVQRIREQNEEAEDGGPGSGPRPGYHKNGTKASLAERAAFMVNPTKGIREPQRPQQTKRHVQRMNKERQEWSNLSIHQKIKGNTEQQRHIQSVKSEVAKAAAKGDIKRAREIVQQNKHYWMNDPTSAQKVQSETLKRQKAAKGGFLRDALRAFLRFFGRDEFVEQEHPRGKGGKFVKKGSGSVSEPVDNRPQESYNGKATKGWNRLKSAMKVGGPKAAREYIKSYFADHPEVAKEAPKYIDVRRKVNDFLKDHPNAENFNTYDADTGEVKNITSGYCVTFHQNNTADDPLGGYSDEDYANLCAIAMHELGANGVNIGYYGNPEVSFECQSEEAAKRFAVEHNQQSVYNASTGRTLANKQYRPDLNPIRL